jgi:hypothetical protein
LIKLVALAFPSYAKSSFTLAFSLRNKLDKLFKDLWWDFLKGKSRNLLSPRAPYVSLVLMEV